MSSVKPLPGPGIFQWNGGAWFGSQLGSTAWMLVGASLLARSSPGTSLLWLGGFALVNALGVALWRRRDRIAPYPGIQALLAAIGAATIALLLSVYLRPDLGRLVEGGKTLDLRSMITVSLLVPVLMFTFYLRERGARTRLDR